MSHPDSIYACTNWYADQTIDLLKEAHIDFVWLTWSAGFSTEAENNQRRIAREYAKKCRENGIRSVASMSVANIVFTDSLESTPLLGDWSQVGPDGNPITYGTAADPAESAWRIACLNHPGWMAYFLKRVDAALEAGFDGIEYDIYGAVCHCERCKEGFCEFSRDFLGEELELPTGAATSNEKDDQRVARLVYERYQKCICDRIYSAVREHANKIKSDLLLYDNLKTGRNASGLVSAITGMQRIQPDIVSGKPISIGSLRCWRAERSGPAPIHIKRRSDAAPAAPRDSAKDQLSIAEAASHGVPFQIVPGGNLLSDLFFKTPAGMERWRAIADYSRFFAENEDLFVDAVPEAQLGVLVNSGLLDDDSAQKERFLAALARNRVIFDVVTDEALTAGRLQGFKALLLPDTKYLSDDQAELIANFARGGGKVLAFGDAGCYDERFRKRGESAIKDIQGLVRLNEPFVKDEGTGKGDCPAAAAEPNALAQIVSAINETCDEPLVSVEGPDHVLYNIMYQSAPGRHIVHILNYSDEIVRDVKVHASFPIASKEILSPDETKLRIRTSANSVSIAQLKVYCVLALEPEDADVEAFSGPSIVERGASALPTQDAAESPSAAALETTETAQDTASAAPDVASSAEAPVTAESAPSETINESAPKPTLPDIERREAVKRYRSSKIALARERKRKDGDAPQARTEKKGKAIARETRDEAAKLIDELFDCEDHPGKDLVKRILDCGDEIVPRLIEIVKGAEELQWEDSRGGGWTPLHAVRFLGEMRATDAIKPMVELIHRGTGLELREEITVALVKIGPPADEVLTGILLDKGEAYTARSAAATILVYTTLFHYQTKARLFGVFRDILAESDEDSRIIGDLACDLCDIRALELCDDLIRACEEGRLSSDFVSPDEIEEMRDGQDTGDYSVPFLLKRLIESLLEDYEGRFDESFPELLDRLAGKEGLVEYISRVPLPGFPRPRTREDESDAFPPPPPLEGPKPIMADPKVGRNDPCPCGSGKKYKKCCMGR